ncbi:serine hydrolase domain-containing protein [Marinobacter sp. DY40_1A1]|uniref:serine hydrolase domain-containing protein n=1 Tax=Marinobacter sp. DY40_1A1 TaxID=2583229 RepID=UPI001907B104|nr:serine hydrolase domain-containing protein [Marinobacter sp. DY40_1A1]MBK1885415.1 beta-lactamase family protein [Marinobacter sp. DY40_1A1]
MGEFSGQVIVAVKKKSCFKDLVAIIVLVSVLAVVSHLVITNPMGPSRLLYYLQAPVVQWKVKCSVGAPEWMSKIQRYASLNMGAAASQLAYIGPGGDQHHCESGWKDKIWGDESLDAKVRFRFASTTKTVTAIAVLNLINQNKVSLDDTIVDILELRQTLKDPRVGNITIEHLLSHRAGWDRERTQDVMFLRNIKPWCPSSPEKLSDTSLLYNPGEMEAYSNLGYCLLGLAIEKVSGKTYRDYIRDSFEMNNTTLEFIDGPYMLDEVSYDFRHEEFYGVNYYKAFDFQALSSSAGLSGNALDLAKLVSASLSIGPITILNGDMSSGCNSANIQECYGYGVYRYQPNDKDIPLYIHGGNLPGASSVIVVTPDGSVLVWLGAGSPRPGSKVLPSFYNFIRESAFAD